MAWLDFIKSAKKEKMSTMDKQRKKNSIDLKMGKKTNIKHFLCSISLMNGNGLKQLWSTKIKNYTSQSKIKSLFQNDCLTTICKEYSFYDATSIGSFDLFLDFGFEFKAAIYA